MAGGGAEHKKFREEHQRAESTWGVQKAQKPVPMTATPVTKSNPGLGAATLPHPFKNGKPQI